LSVLLPLVSCTHQCFRWEPGRGCEGVGKTKVTWPHSVLRGQQLW